MLQGPLVPPERAVQLGLVDELSSDPRGRAAAILGGLAKLPRAAYAMMKDDLRGAVAPADAVAHQRFIDEVLPVWTGDDLKQRIARFL